MPTTSTIQSEEVSQKPLNLSSKFVLFGTPELEEIERIALGLSFGGDCDATDAYEQALSRTFGTEWALSTCSGTAALYLALRSRGIGPGDEVVVSPLGAVMTVLPLLELGATPVFADTSSVFSFQLDSASVARVRTKATRAVVVASMWGYLSIGPGLREYCDQNSLLLIDDAAQAHGSRDADGIAIGARAHVGCFSTHNRKLVTTGEGGFVITNSVELRDQIFTARTLGKPMGGGMAFGENTGLNLKLSGLLAGAGLAQLKRLDHRVAERHRVGDKWLDYLSKIEQIVPLRRPKTHNGYGLAIHLGSFRNDVESALLKLGVETDTHRYSYRPVYQYPLLASHRPSCPNAEALADGIVVLPCHEAVTTEAIEIVSDRISKLVSNA